MFRPLTNLRLSRRSAVQAGLAMGAGAFAATQSGLIAPRPAAARLQGIEREQLTVAIHALPAGLDPGIESSNVAFGTLHNAFDTLLRRDFQNDNALTPALATGWESLSDTEHVFTLRENVAFHDGTVMTADDVVASFERILNAEEGSPLLGLRGWIQTIATVEAIDDLHVKFTTTDPDPVLLLRLTLGPCCVIPRSYAEAYAEDPTILPTGTGPYRITGFTPDVELVMERHDDYWDTVVPVRQLTFSVVPEIAARTTALINQEVDVITNLTPDQIEAFNSVDAADVREVMLANVHVVVYNTHQPGLEDKRLRQALNLAIDRALIKDALWLGHATHLRGMQFEDYGELYNPDRPLTPYDPERARALVAESDYNGEPIAYQNLSGYYINGDPTAAIIVQMWQEIGVNAEVQLVETTMTGYDRFAHTWSNSNLWSDPASAPYRLFGQGSAFQNLYWDAPAEFNELGESAQRTLDTAERFASYQRILDLFEEEAPGTDILQPADIYAALTSINWEPSPIHHMDFRAYNLSFNE